MFGIRTVIFEPGYFRTQALSPKNIQHQSPSVSAYTEFNKMVLAYEASMYGNEPGDPVKAVARMVDVITSTGTAAGKEMPVRLPLGSDGLKVIRDKCQNMLKLCDEWESVIVSTDFVK